MTAEEFKKLKPEYSSLEGDDLWDAMTMYVLSQQQASETIKTSLPFFKTHTLRWLYYRRIPNLVWGNYKTDKWISDKRCSKCKWGVNQRLVWSFRDANDVWHSQCKCPHCNEDYVAEPNTNISHKVYMLLKRISRTFWFILDWLHLVRSCMDSRYSMGGDESRYVSMFSMNMKTGEAKYILKKRKWWEYIFIEKPTHNFFR